MSKRSSLSRIERWQLNSQAALWRFVMSVDRHPSFSHQDAIALVVPAHLWNGTLR